MLRQGCGYHAVGVSSGEQISQSRPDSSHGLSHFSDESPENVSGCVGTSPLGCLRGALSTGHSTNSARESAPPTPEIKLNLTVIGIRKSGGEREEARVRVQSIYYLYHGSATFGEKISKLQETIDFYDRLCSISV